MTALEDYLGKATQGTSGIPINYYLKDIDQKMLAQMWAAKYYPGEFMAIKESESELSAWQNLEEEFLKRTNDWKPNFMEGLPKIPVRSEYGDIDTVQLSKEWQGWHDVLPQMGILDSASKHGGKPA
ncbi:uncharacterized protein FFMR_09019 [Fusarium fujikuroi]|nr:uncharacterized protein FFMR_09019 [Fusarium fujikuroi]